MVALAIISALMAAQAPATLAARADEAGGAYIQCLFGVVREANAARISQSAFERRLNGSCRTEQRAHRELGIRILELRGEPSPEASVDLLDRQIRQGMIDDYRALPQKVRMLRQFNALCAANPGGCR